MKKSIHLIIAMLLLFTACDSSVFSKKIAFETHQWKKGESHSFEFDNPGDKDYELWVDVRYTYGVKAPYSFTTQYKTPDGKVGAEMTEVNVKDGDCAGDICDISQKVLVLPKKKSKFQVEMMSNADNLHIHSLKVYIK